MKLIRIAIFCVLASAGTSVHAVPMMYEFTSGPYGNVAGVGVDSVTFPFATFTVDLAANYSGAGSPTDWSFSDGVTTITSTTPGYAVTVTDFVTDAAGVLNDAFIQVFNTGPIITGLNYFQRINTGIAGLLPTGTGYIQPPGGGFIVSAPNGSLRLVSVPEPSVIALFGAGLFGIGFARRRMRN